MVKSKSGLLHTVFLCFLWSFIQFCIILSDAQQNLCPKDGENDFGPCRDTCIDDRNCSGFAACCYQGCINPDKTETLRKQTLYKICVNRDLCREGMCKNGALCVRQDPHHYTCLCKPGYTGINCSSEINECDSNPCQHGGECTDLLADYLCCCPPGRTGKNCEIDLKCQNSKYLLDHCLDKTCKNVKDAMCIMEYKFVVKHKNGTITDVTDQCSP